MINGNDAVGCEAVPLKSNKLALVGERLSKLFADMVNIKDRLEKKRNYCFGARPEQPNKCGGELRGVPQGVAGAIKETIFSLENIANEIKGVVLDLEDL